MRKIFFVLFFGILSAFLNSSLLFAGEIDILVDKLVDKGILSSGEAQVILTETKEEIRKDLAKGTLEGLPKWVQNTKLNGDFRLRYQWEDKLGSEERHRSRYRFRLGLESKVNDTMKVAAGLATGGDDARSTNQTMDDGFSTEDIKLDYAYAQFVAAPGVTFKAGKIKGIKKLIFRPSDLLWDSDINPEGVSILLSKRENNTDWFMNTGVWILDESSSDTSDSFMWVVQPGMKYSFNKSTCLKIAVAGYFFENIKGTSLNNGGSKSSGYYNTLERGGLKYDYNSVAPSFEFGIKKPLGGLVPYLAIFGDYVYNMDPSEKNKGYLGGIKFGAKKVKDWRQWQAKYMYRHLEKDAWIDIFPDSDAYSGYTDTKGHEVAFTYGLGKNATLGFDYYYMTRITGDSNRKHVVQVDWQVKF
ncbi:MAG: putative porin [Candidatus Omnitrophica bacterium]|nr:putative porin [Candidatus Omnitrophota bacterium]